MRSPRGLHCPDDRAGRDDVRGRELRLELSKHRPGRAVSRLVARLGQNRRVGADRRVADREVSRGGQVVDLSAVDEERTRLDANDARYYRQRSLVYLFTDCIDLAQADDEMCEELRN